MTPTLPLPAHAGFCLLVPDFLDAHECRKLIALSEGRGFVDAGSDYPASYRNNSRHVIDSKALAARLERRLRAHAPATLAADDGRWRFDGINERFRFCRYEPGQRFNLHQDGVYHRTGTCRSHLTLLVYLSDGAACAGGDTVFYAHGPGAAADGSGAHELGRVRPRAGSLLLFDHAIWHAGDDVTAGTKHVLRSDVLYRTTASHGNDADASEHRGYVWTLAALADGFTASGGRDATIRIRDAAGRAVRHLPGHAQSVLGLAALPGRRLASVSRDRSLRIWNWTSGACEAKVTAHDGAVLDVIALRDGALATAGADGLVKLWRQDGGAVGNIAGHRDWVWQLAECADGAIASASEDGSVRLWYRQTLRCGAVLEADQPLRTLLVMDDEIWTGDIGGRVTRWRRGAGGWTIAARFDAHHAAIRRLRRVGETLVASCGEDGALRVWDRAGGAPVFEARHDNFVTDALDCGAAILSSSYDGRILRHEWPPAGGRR